jgi:hypothetical protein
VVSLHSEQLNVMTRNMDAGSDFWYVLTADQNNLSAILVAITQTYQEMLASNIAQRADGIAAEIQNRHPDMVALQEVTTLSSGSYGSPELTYSRWRSFGRSVSSSSATKKTSTPAGGRGETVMDDRPKN